jgi:starvation-inducible DNA-binding protein
MSRSSKAGARLASGTVAPGSGGLLDLVTVRLHAATVTARGIHDRVDAEGPSTTDLLHEIIVELEKYAWMVSAENRVA